MLLGRQTEMLIGTLTGDTTARGTLQKSLLDKIGFNHVLYRLLLLTDGSRQVIQPHGPAEEFIEDRQQQLAIHIIEPLLVHIQHVQGTTGHLDTDMAIGADLGIVPYPSQQTVGNPWCTTSSSGDLEGPLLHHAQPQTLGTTHDDIGQIRHLVELQALDNAEAIPQRRG